MKKTKKARPSTSGKLKIGDDWNAITIIALSQSNPLKAVAEFVENSIDARAKTITITRGKEKGEPYLRIRDDGEGIRRNAEGLPDFRFVATLDAFKGRAWTSGYLQGIVDCPCVQLTPGTRLEIIQDAAFERFLKELAPVEAQLAELIEAQERAEQEQTSRDVLKSIQEALKEALMALPAEEYDWFDIQRTQGKARPADARDRSRHRVEKDLTVHWTIAEGNGRLEAADGEIVTFLAPEQPELVRLRVTARQGEIVCEGEALVTVTDSILPETAQRDSPMQGIPGYTFQKSPGELWRSRFDGEQNVVVINNGHRDFVYASKTKALKLRYICRLFAKELVLRNFTGLPDDQLLERLIELTLYTENHLK